MRCEVDGQRDNLGETAVIYHAVCDRPRDITQCEADGQRDNPGVTAARYHAVCDGREISRGTLTLYRVVETDIIFLPLGQDERYFTTWSRRSGSRV